AKTTHNRVIYNQETAWLKRIDSQTTICKIFYPIKSMPFVALQGRPLQSATIGYAITPNPVRPFKLFRKNFAT
ncbi:MAG: hypothetical protein MRZ70_06135, partial [Prevotella sp.]|nr:hypothetical protein [Prevotella sp.]